VKRPESRLLVLAALVVTTSACAVRPAADGAPKSGSAIPPELPADPVPRPEARSRYGNGPVYEVFGRPYRVLDSSYGYRERGVASWYGRKFHGRPTSSREPYDMHQMTAAHKTLPLPTYARVRNLKNGRSVVVRVNDRGPFVDNRLIDLSYAAARRLGMVQDGTTLVEVSAISFDEPPEIPASKPAAGSDDRGTTDYHPLAPLGALPIAERRHRMVSDGGIANAFVFEDAGRGAPLYRVRIGPIADADHYDALVGRLTELGIGETHIVTD